MTKKYSIWTFFRDITVGSFILKGLPIIIIFIIVAFISQGMNTATMKKEHKNDPNVILRSELPQLVTKYYKK